MFSKKIKKPREIKFELNNNKSNFFYLNLILIYIILKISFKRLTKRKIKVNKIILRKYINEKY